MVVKILYKHRDLYLTGQKKPVSLQYLINYLSKNKNNVNEIKIDGQTNSFTFVRQIYLLSNLFSRISAAKVIINKERVLPNKQKLPVYKY